MIYEKYWLGEIPRMHRRLLPEGALESALNVNLEDGSIKPWKCPEKICSSTTEPDTIYNHEACCYDNSGLPWVRYKNSGCDYYVRNAKLKLEWARDPCGTWCDFTMPCPSAPPTVQIQGEESCDPVGVSYLYTYVHELGFESAPSRPSTVVMSGSGRATLTGFEEPRSSCIKGIRIYRLNEGQQAGQGAPALDADYFHVGDITLAETSFEDTTGNGCSGIPLHSAGAFPPPRGIEGLEVMSNGALVAFKGCQLYFSDPVDLEPNPHSWSGDYDIELQDNIKSILAIGESLYVATDGHPYIVDARSAGGRLFYDYARIPQKHPIVSEDSLHQAGSGAGYLSSTGLIHFARTRDGTGATVITDRYFTRSNWRKAGIYNAIEVGGRAVLIGANKSYIMWPGNPQRAPSEFTPMSEIDLLGKPKVMFADENEDLIYSAPDGLYKFTFEHPEDEDECCPYDVLSRIHVSPECHNFAGGKIVTDGQVQLDFYKVDCDESLVKESRLVGCGPFRLPAKYAGTDYQYRLRGCSTVYSVHFAETFHELGSR